MDTSSTKLRAALGAILAVAGALAAGALLKRRSAGAPASAPSPAPGPAAQAAAADAAPADAELAEAPAADPTDRLVAREEAAAAEEAAAVGGPIPPRSAGDPAMRAVEEAGGGEAEGFELAEEDLVANATHADGHGAPLLDRIDEESLDEPADPEYAEADDAQPHDT